MLKINLQFFGGRGAGSGRAGGATGGIGANDILSTTSLISERETKKDLVDQTMAVFKDVYDQYGETVNDIQLATLKPGANALAYYDSAGNVAINKAYFNKNMEKAYKESVESGFHPSNGNKTALQAVTAHELGHRLTDAVGVKMGYKEWSIDKAAKRIVKESGVKNTGKISGYAKSSHAEAIAEAYADVYCNGTKASRVSKSIVKTMNKYLNN